MDSAIKNKRRIRGTGLTDKEKEDACAALVRVMDDHGMVEYDKVSINECDRYLRQAIEEYFEVDYEDEDEDDDWDY